MKKAIYLLLAILCLQVNALAQKHCPMNKKEFREKQQVFLTQRAQLTPEEAQKFFPLFFELQDKKEQKNREAWKNIRKGKEGNLSEEEYSRLTEEVLKARLESSQLDLEYLYKYQKILPARKIYDIQRAEMRFHRELLRPQRHKKR